MLRPGGRLFLLGMLFAVSLALNWTCWAYAAFLDSNMGEGCPSFLYGTATCRHAWYYAVAGLLFLGVAIIALLLTMQSAYRLFVNRRANRKQESTFQDG